MGASGWDQNTVYWQMDGPSGGGGDAGLVKVGSRYYDPADGRFTSRDSDIGQLPYAYCGGDPINFTDPSGHDARGDFLTGLGILLAAILVIAALPAEAIVGLGALGGLAVIGAFTIVAGLTLQAGKEYSNEQRNKSTNRFTEHDPTLFLKGFGGFMNSIGFQSWDVYNFNTKTGKYDYSYTSFTNPNYNLPGPNEHASNGAF